MLWIIFEREWITSLLDRNRGVYWQKGPADRIDRVAADIGADVVTRGGVWLAGVQTPAVDRVQIALVDLVHTVRVDQLHRSKGYVI